MGGPGRASLCDRRMSQPIQGCGRNRAFSFNPGGPARATRDRASCSAIDTQQTEAC